MPAPGAGGVQTSLVGTVPGMTSFVEGELSKPSHKFVGGKSRMNLGIYTGPGTPPNTDWHHYLDPNRNRPRPEGAAARYDARGIGCCPQGPREGLGRPRHPVPAPDLIDGCSYDARQWLGTPWSRGSVAGPS